MISSLLTIVNNELFLLFYLYLNSGYPSRCCDISLDAYVRDSTQKKKNHCVLLSFSVLKTCIFARGIKFIEWREHGLCFWIELGSNPGFAIYCPFGHSIQIFWPCYEHFFTVSSEFKVDTG